MRNFKCQKCSSCCRQPGFVYLEREEEAKALADFLNLDLYDFTGRYCEVLEKRHLVLRKLPDEACIFLGLKGCWVYEARPAQCRDFPYKWRTPNSEKYCEGLKKAD